MAMTLVSTVTVGAGGAASIEFTGIAGTGKDLLVLLSGRTTDANVGTLQIRLNNNSGNYAVKYIEGYGNTQESSQITSDYLYRARTPGSNDTSNTFGNLSMYVSNYTSSATKSISIDNVTENNATGARQQIMAANSALTSAVTSIQLAFITGNFVQYSTASLYIIS